MRWLAELRELRALIAEIDAREERAVSLRNRLNRSTRTDYSLCRLIEDEEHALLRVRDRQVRRVARAELAIAKLRDPMCRSVLQMRYLLGMPWDRIGAQLGYERTTLWRIHKRALNEMDAREGVTARASGGQFFLKEKLD